MEARYDGAALIYEHPDGRQIVQVFKHERYENWAINPELLISCFRFVKGAVRFQLVDPDVDERLPSEGWGKKPRFLPDWENAIPVTTLLRELAKTGDFYGGGFFRLHNREIED